MLWLTSRLPEAASSLVKRRSTFTIRPAIRCSSTGLSSTMKRKLTGAAATQASSPSKRIKPEVPEYHLTPSVKDVNGDIQWPAPIADISRARQIIVDCANAKAKVVIVPDKDADGLSAGAILHHTLLLLGLPKGNIQSHLLSKGTTVHSENERTRMAASKPSYVFVLDQGSRPGPPLIQNDHVGLVIDHHFANETDFPQGSEHVSACHSPPVATSALLTYEICKVLHPDVETTCDWLCCVGTHGDLGTTLKWEPPFPDMKPTFKKYSKKTINDVVSLVNAPRRTASFDVQSAWTALCDATEPSKILKNPRLLAARAEINAEVETCTHTAPKFSADNKVAVFRINSPCQVHPVIATRWAGHLTSNSLEIVLVANEGYLPGKVNFSCRIARCARGREEQVDIIRSLRAYASLPRPVNEDDVNTEPADAPSLLERLGDDFARGHVQASGGIVSVPEFEELMERMQVGVKIKKSTDAKPKTKSIDPGQKNTLTGYFTKK